ncbi:unnamed protein product [Ilex paraguariensis]|uniref:Uncharacterized protein n=1 Tax=Ilex paraguariensis TaxID=185542 RepID=A0ABC8UBA1_9AQUA
MASVPCSARPSQSILGFHRPSCKTNIPFINLLNLGPISLSIPLSVRLKTSVRLQVRQNSLPVFTSNTNPVEESDGSKISDAAQGPPFLTILAGFLVFSIIVWIVGSIVMWLISLIFHVPPSK